MITIENIINHELIGIQASVTESCNKQIVGLSGRILDETKSMFTLDTLRGIKRIPKANSSWKFDLEGKNIIVNGDLISKRSHERMAQK